MVVPQSLTPLELSAISPPLTRSGALGDNVVNPNERGLQRKLTKRQQPSTRLQPQVRTETTTTAKEKGHTSNSDKKLSILGLLQYATRFDRGLQITGCLASIIAGATMPLMIIVLGSSIQIFVTAATTGDKLYLVSDATRHIFQLIVLGGVAMVSTYTQNICWMLAGESISSRIREAYMGSLLHQDIQYLDDLGSERMTAAITSHINIIQDAISHKTGLFISSASTIIAALVVALMQNWKLAIMIGAIQPIWTIPTGILFVQVAKNAERAATRCSQGRFIASEIITQISTVRSIGMYEVMAEQYENFLRRSERCLINKSFWSAVVHAWSYLLLYLAYSFACWITEDNLDIGTIFRLLFSIIVGMLALGRMAQYLKSFRTAFSVSKQIGAMIDQGSQKNRNPLSRKWRLIDGDIFFEDVIFSYASEPGKPVLDHFDLYVPEGKTTAIIGASEAEKSAIAGLLERFYDPTSGCISIDALPIETFNLSALRSQISFLPQKPSILSMSIYDNVRIGLVGSPFENARPWIQRRLILEACRAAGLFGFIDALPKQWDTRIGPKSTILSSSQKRLLAFARAIIRGPRVLILDEPTAGLDLYAESIIQDALERYAIDRTVVILTQRLPTIRHADSIALIDGGRIIEQGTHDQLMHHRSAYFSLFQAQRSLARPVYTPEGTNSGSPRPGAVRMPSIPETSRWSSSTFSHPNTDEDDDGDGVAAADAAPRPSAAASKRAPSTPHYLLQILRFNLRSDAILLALALLATLLSAAAAGPVQAFLLAKMVSLFATAQKDAAFYRNANLVSLAFVIVAGVMCAANFVRSLALGVCKERMVRQVRSTLFRCILRKEGEWFGEEGHAVGELVDFLDRGCARLAGLHVTTLVVFIEMAVSVISCVAFSLAVSWEYAIVMVSVVPIVIIVTYLRMLVRGYWERAVEKWHTQDANLASEAIGDMRSVVALTREKQLLHNFSKAVRKASRQATWSIVRSSFIFSVGYGMIYLVNAFAIWYGATLFSEGRIDLYQYLAIYFALAFGVNNTFDLAGQVPDFAAGKAIAKRLMKLSSQEGEARDQGSSSNDATLPNDLPCIFILENVSYTNHSRSQYPVLSNINLVIPPNHHVALLGAPGSGKTTLLHLLARLSTPTSGSIKLSSQFINTIASTSYRPLVALIPKDPVVFPGSIRFNLLFDTPDDSISQHALEIACRQANILDFIESLPEGFETLACNVPLSRGQKQRLAIARALVRNPRVLLLDEVMDGLEALEKREVLVALESAVKGRTTVSVVGSLGSLFGLTVDYVHVLDRGRVVESGTSVDILRSRGALPGMAR